jgi:hypothetical protein
MGAISPFPTTASLADLFASAKQLAPTLQQQCEDNISTDSSSFDDETKKRKRKLFSFGKKSSKAKAKNS